MFPRTINRRAGDYPTSGPPAQTRRSPYRRALALFMVGLLLTTALHLERASRFQPAKLAVLPGPLVLDRKGEILHLVPDRQGRKVVELPAGKLPPMVVAAFVAAEDQRFWRHPGVDFLAVARAALQNLTAGRIVSGASTLTQQLARLAYPGPRTYRRKVVEMVRSLRLEARFSKEDLLRFYLNRVPLGGNLVGVETAALAYFGKSAAALTAGEAAFLAALAKAPTALRPHGPRHDRLLARQKWVLHRLARLGYLSPGELAAALEEPLLFAGPGKGTPVFPFKAPHWVETVLKQKGGPLAARGPLRTTLDFSLQRRVEAVVRSHRAPLLRAGASQAAAVVLDNQNLEVLALVGSHQYGARDQGYVNGALALRSPGSALKPFLYAHALDQGLSPAQVLEDVERRYRTPWGQFLPANFDRTAHGPVPFREALGNSLNLSAVYLLNLVGYEPFYDTLRKLNLINHPHRGPEHYGLGLVVGNPEVSLLQLAAAYAALANGGGFRPPRLILDDPPEPGLQVFSPQAAYIVSDILADPLARGRIFGGAQAMNPMPRLALKTGTSTRYRDCWCVAYSPEYTIAVWVGNFKGQPTANLSGAAAAAPIVADLAREVFGTSLPGEFSRPEGLVERQVCAFSGLLPGPGCLHQRRELFVAGTVPSRTCTFHQPREPWHQMPTTYAGWLKDRYTKGGEGRFRLAGFPRDLDLVFYGAGNRAVGSSPPPIAPPITSQEMGGRETWGMVGKQRALRLTYEKRLVLGNSKEFRPWRRPGPPNPEEAPSITISYPLNGDHFLLPPGAETLRLTLKASCRLPFRGVVWFVDGLEQGVTGPPYEITVNLSRGRHHLTALAPDGLGDRVQVVVE